MLHRRTLDTEYVQQGICGKEENGSFTHQQRRNRLQIENWIILVCFGAIPVLFAFLPSLHPLCFVSMKEFENHGWNNYF